MNETRTRIPFSQHYYAENEDGTRTLSTPEGKILGVAHKTLDGAWAAEGIGFTSTLHVIATELASNKISDGDYTIPGTSLQVSKVDSEGRNYVHSGREVFGYISRVEGTPAGVYSDARGNVYGSMVAAAVAVRDAYHAAYIPALTAAQYTEKMAAVPFQHDAMSALDSAIEKIKAGFEAYLRQTHGHGLTDENHRAIFKAAGESNTNAADIETQYARLAPGVRFSQNKN